jgi:hypothetical protein
MSKILQLSLRTLFVAVLMLSLGACSDSSSSRDISEVSTTTIEGLVVDGYVEAAQVQMFDLDSSDFSAPVASAATDDQGRFSFQIPVDQVPEQPTFRTMGGYSTDTGLPAPSMSLWPDSEATQYTVTPITDLLVRERYRASWSGTEEQIADKLGLQIRDMYRNPLASDSPMGLQRGLERALAYGGQDVALPDGDYQIALLQADNRALDKDMPADISALTASEHYMSGSLTIDGHQVSGTLDEKSLSGRIQGANLVLSVEYSGGVVRLAGSVGIMGSFSGTLVDFDSSGPELTSGAFVASLMPAEGIDADGLRDFARGIYASERNMAFRDLYGDMDLGWGAISNVEIEGNTLTTDGFTVALNQASGSTDNLTFKEGQLLTNADGVPNGLAVLRYTDSSGDDAFLLHALGNRRGIYVAGDTSGNEDGNIYAIGESYMARRDALGGDFLLENAGEAIDLASSNVSPDWIGKDRPQTTAEFVTLNEGVALPAVTYGVGASGSSSVDGVTVLSGSMLGYRNSASGISDSDMDASTDEMFLATVYATGALQGDMSTGGDVSIDSFTVSAKDWPIPWVGYAAQAGVNTGLLDFGGVQMDFLFRPIYTVDLEIDNLVELSDYQNNFAFGTLQLEDGTATLTYEDAQGETGTLELTITNLGGVYHFQGPMNDEYLDILWPAGGSRALMLSSTAEDGRIYEIGEAFMTF